MSGDQSDGKTCLTDVLTGCLLCKNAELGVDGHSPIGNPVEQALLAAGKAEGMDKRQLETRFAQVREIAFDPTAKLMGTVHRADDDFVMWVKGAPEEVLEACSTNVQTDGVNARLTPEKRAFWKSRTDQMAARGMRVCPDVACFQYARSTVGRAPQLNNLKQICLDRLGSWQLPAVLGLVPLGIGQITKALSRLRHRQNHAHSS